MEDPSVPLSGVLSRLAFRLSRMDGRSDPSRALSATPFTGCYVHKLVHAGRRLTCRCSCFVWFAGLMSRQSSRPIDGRKLAWLLAAFDTLRLKPASLTVKVEPHCSHATITWSPNFRRLIPDSTLPGKASNVLRRPTERHTCDQRPQLDPGDWRLGAQYHVPPLAQSSGPMPIIKSGHETTQTARHSQKVH
ncbi:hypothetical protein BDY21DRAFT_362132 [Lineolata rhizophorae]|uniref:Uncharacterized protein n=1 Tax=Lineolata rhizophorae TaxID=578093 RepID=A0A6A6P5W0_9PEZI|nr:hypothetical protein BDY21DRAFT_362132 [Lineolata rhizophorae]